jgi:integrase
MMWNINLWMGTRIGEARALRWKCVDWETGRVTVVESLFEGKSSKPKTKAGERGVVLNEAQLAELKLYKQNHYPQAEPEGWLSGVNYFFSLTTIISPYQRQLLLDC